MRPIRARTSIVGVIAGMALLLAGGLGFVNAQTVSIPFEARVVAYKHDSGAVEVAIEQDGERHLPESRFVTVTAPAGLWLRSSPVTLSVDVAEPVEPPVERFSVRPSEFEDAGLVCLEQEDEDGNTWTRLDETGSVVSFSTVFGIYSAGTWNGSALKLQLEGAPDEDWLELRLASAWHAQCAQYHGAAGLPHEHATDPDSWMTTDTAETDPDSNQ